jgi:hypothetical protein
MLQNEKVTQEQFTGKRSLLCLLQKISGIKIQKFNNEGFSFMTEELHYNFALCCVLINTLTCFLMHVTGY